MNKERYRRGAHTVTDFQYHFVWKTKYGYRVLKDDIGLRLRAIIKEICSEHQMDIVKGNIRANHIHILVRAPSHLSPAKMLQYLKGKSSYRLQREFAQLRKRYWGQHLWSRGYFGATVGAVTEEQIKQYIENQVDGDKTFKIWDEKDDMDNAGPLLQSDSSEGSDDFQS